MLLTSMRAKNYRSLRSIRMELANVNLFIGQNGAGKSNLYRALQLIQAAVRGRFSHEIAVEGGMGQARWSGRRKRGEEARICLEAELMDPQNATTFCYRIEAGLRPSEGAGFALEPQIKEEELTIDLGRRPITIMKRTGPSIMVRGDYGRMEHYPEQALIFETAISLLGDAGHYPEISQFRHFVQAWRFFHGFRTDRDSPLRAPCLAVTSLSLDEDGANLAAVFGTLRTTRGDTAELERAVFDAFGGAKLHIPSDAVESCEFGLILPEFPQRIFQARELSDGQLRFLALAGALLSYRLPPFIALNEPEASLHPDMLEPLARMIAKATESSQVWIVTHSERLAQAVQAQCGLKPRRVIRQEGATWIEGMTILGTMREEEEEEIE